MISAEYDHVELGSIIISGANPRKTFSDESLRELADSIREHGILEPLVVRPGTEPDTYELVAGERRLRAAKLAGWKMAPVVIRDLTDEAAAEIMLIENLQREDLAPLEVATALQQLLAGGSTQADLGRRLGKSQSWISNHLRLLGAPEDLKKLLISREITPKHANVLLPIAGGRYPAYDRAMEDLKREAKNGPVSVKRLEQIVESTLGNDYSGERVLNFDNPGWHHKDLLPYIDAAKCEPCPHRMEVQIGRKKNKVCLNAECFKAALQAAKGRKDAERQAARDAMLNAPEGREKGLDLDLLAYSEYDQLVHARFDVAGCEGCQHNRQSRAGAAVCLKPECFREKVEQHRKALKAVELDWERKASEASNAHLAARSGPLNDRELRLILETVAASYGFDPMSIIEPWIPNAEELGVDDAQQCIDAIPDADLPKALLALVLSNIMEDYGTDHKALIGRINDLDKPSTHQVKVPAVLAEAEEEEEEGEEKEEEEAEEEKAGTCRRWCCPEDDDAIEAKDLDEAKMMIGCLDCELLTDPIEGCEGPEEVSR